LTARKGGARGAMDSKLRGARHGPGPRGARERESKGVAGCKKESPDPRPSIGLPPPRPLRLLLAPTSTSAALPPVDPCRSAPDYSAP
jgi:hypothetical protein